MLASPIEDAIDVSATPRWWLRPWVAFAALAGVLMLLVAVTVAGYLREQHAVQYFRERGFVIPGGGYKIWGSRLPDTLSLERPERLRFLTYFKGAAHYQPGWDNRVTWVSIGNHKVGPTDIDQLSAFPYLRQVQIEGDLLTPETERLLCERLPHVAIRVTRQSPTGISRLELIGPSPSKTTK